MIKRITELLRVFYDRHAPDAVKNPQSPDYWNEKILYMFVLISIPVGLFVFVAGVPVSIMKGDWFVVIASLAGYPACIIVFLFPGMKYLIRAMTACFIVYFLGLSLILDVGPFIGTREYFFAFSILASFLLGWAGVIFSIMINILTFAAISVLVYTGFWSNQLNLESPLREWFMIVVDLIFINISTTALITLFFKRIKKSDTAAKEYSTLLLAERETLAESNKKLEAEMEVRQAITMALKDSEEKYRTILETIKDAYFEVDLKGNFTFVNNALRNKLGYDYTQLIGLNYRSYMDDVNADKLELIFEKVYSNGESSPTFEIDVRRRDGSLITVSVLVSLLTGKDGSAIGYQGIARNITEHKEMEKRLQRAEKMEAVGTLAGGVAHDLNNTLFGVVGYPELLLMKMKGDDPLRAPLIEIKKSGEKAVAIVQDLLTLARRGVETREVVNLNSVIDDYLNSIEFRNMKTFHPGVNLTTVLDPGLLNISGSPIHLTKTIMNLVSNAAEAIDADGRITISTMNCNLDDEKGANRLLEGDYILLKIEDTGEGIDAEDLDRIFEPFFTKKKMGRSGTGLGMAVVWGTVQDHGGHIEVRSTKGEGTTFMIYLPITREDITEKNDTVSLECYRGNGQRVLIIDDVAVQRDVATRMLRMMNYTVDSVDSGESAVEYIKNNRVDIVLLDMIMRPGIDGLETYRRIKEINPDQKAVIASGFSENDQVAETLKLGAGSFIRKPYSMVSLLSVIKDELER